MPLKDYVLTVPERVVRSVVGISAGLAREVGEVAIPIMAVSAVRSVPDGVKWLGASTVVGVTRTGHVVGAALLDHYRDTLGEIRDVGYLAFARRQFAPYIRAAADHFSPSRVTLTQKLWTKVAALRTRVRREH